MSDHTSSRAFFSRLRSISPPLLLVAFVVVTGLTASAVVWLTPLTKSVEATVDKTQASGAAFVPGNPAQERVETEIITLKPTGFEPSQITRPAGRFFLAITNRSGLEEVSLRLTAEGGNKVKESRVLRKKPRWRDLVDLPPGHYTLTEANHPEWVCQITITTN